jgi:hypothetical protein
VRIVDRSVGRAKKDEDDAVTTREYRNKVGAREIEGRVYCRFGFFFPLSSFFLLLGRTEKLLVL